jgi:hypothetical protein
MELTGPCRIFFAQEGLVQGQLNEIACIFCYLRVEL